MVSPIRVGTSLKLTVVSMSPSNSYFGLLRVRASPSKPAIQGHLFLTAAPVRSIGPVPLLLRSNRLLFLTPHTAVERLARRRHVVRGVVVGKVVQLEVHLGNPSGHDREVFNTGDVFKAERVPDDNVLVNDGLRVVDPGFMPVPPMDGLV